MVLSLTPAAFATEALSEKLDRLLPAIRQVESGGKNNAVGDAGKSIGAYQIQRAYWQDAVEHDPSIGGSYKDCFDPVYAEKIVRAYLDRYAPDDATLEDLARIHNGGPSILKKKNSTKIKEKKAWNNTTKYWQEVKKELNS